MIESIQLSPTEPSDPPDAIAPEPAEEAQPPRPIVLVADPDLQSLRALNLILRMDQYDVRMASTARDTLDALSGSAPRVVIVDREMTGADGVGLAYLVRRANRTVPVVIISARPGELTPAIDGSCRIAKPVDAQRLRTEVKGLIAARPRDRS